MSTTTQEFSDAQLREAIVACVLLNSAGLLRTGHTKSWDGRITDYLLEEFDKSTTDPRWNEVSSRVRCLLDAQERR